MYRNHESTPIRSALSRERGSALISVLLLVVLGFISTAAYIQFQKFLSDENRIVAQKLEAGQWQHALTRAFADPDMCNQFDGLVVNQDPQPDPTKPPTFSGVLPAPAVLYKSGTSGDVWVRQGLVIAGSEMKLGVTRIRLAGLTRAPFAPPAPPPNEYIGFIEIALGQVADPNEPVNMTRPIRPIRIKKRFEVVGAAPSLVVKGCTALPPEILKVDAYKIISPVAGSNPPEMQVENGNTAENTASDTKLSFAECPQGTKVVGGGFQILSGNSKCTEAGMEDVALPVSNYPYQGNFGGGDQSGWASWILCREARAFAYCMTEPPKAASP